MSETMNTPRRIVTENVILHEPSPDHKVNDTLHLETSFVNYEADEPISIAQVTLMSHDEKSNLIRLNIPVMMHSLHDGEILSNLISYTPSGRYVLKPIFSNQGTHHITFYG